MLKFNFYFITTDYCTIFGENFKLIDVMKIQLKREGEILEIKNFAIEVNGNRYRISETIDGRVTINKVSIERDDDSIKVHPRSGNEIEIS